MQHKILIVGTVPYNEKSTSRAFDAYFHYMDKRNLAQIFSNTKKPCKGHCATLFQITDHQILRRWFGLCRDAGRIFNYDDLPTTWDSTDLELNSLKLEKAYKFGRKHTPLTHLLRGILWRKRFWCTQKLNNWLDTFSPECVFLAFSDDYFILQIALYVAERYDIPIVSCIGDDYYFNEHTSFDPLYCLYKKTYKRLVRKVFAHYGSAVYISEKIKKKYNSEFGLTGETVYLSSSINRAMFTPINTEAPYITYFGNIRMGRNHSLCDIANALSRINSHYKLSVYSNEVDASYIKILLANQHIDYYGSIPYSEVKTLMPKSDITIIAEGFKKEHIDKSRYSLSTKVADTLASGAVIFAYGSCECGVIEYMEQTGAAVVCSDNNHLESIIRDILFNVEKQKRYYDRQIVITSENHTLKKSTQTVEALIDKVIWRSTNG